MAWDFRSLLIPAAQVALARSVAVTLSPTAGANMWTTPLSSTGSDPATWYISTGLISPEFAALVPEQTWEQDENGDWVQTGSTPGDPVLCYQMCVAGGLTVTQAEIDALYAAADVTAQEPFTALGRKGLKMIQAQVAP